MRSQFIPLTGTNFNCFGHRGACGYAPENTLSSFALAQKLGCHWVELDVYSVEGELLVIHDDTLERTTNGQGEVIDQELTYLRSLDAGDGQKIPTLDEVTSLLGQHTGINIELKGPATAAPVSAFIQQCLARGWSRDHFLVSSFDLHQLAEFRQLDGVQKLGCLFHKKTDDMVEHCIELDAYSINISIKLANPDLVNQAHSAGLKVYVYTVNEPKDIQRMLAMNVDGVFSDFPDRVFKGLEDH
jgi:glycerophosphoryl diester phosphodiesterase